MDKYNKILFGLGTGFTICLILLITSTEALTLTIYPEEDCYTAYNSTAKTGTFNYFYARRSASPQYLFTLYNFDDLPAGSNITDITYRVFKASSSGWWFNNDFVGYSLNTSWNENNTDFYNMPNPLNWTNCTTSQDTDQSPYNLYLDCLEDLIETRNNAGENITLFWFSQDAIAEPGDPPPSPSQIGFFQGRSTRWFQSSLWPRLIITYEYNASVPVITLTSPGNQVYSDLPIPINFTLNKSVESCFYQLNAGNETPLNGSGVNWTGEISGLDQGYYEFYIECEDEYLNSGNETAYFYYLAPPTPGPTTNASISFILEYEDLAVVSRSTCLDSDWLNVQSIIQTCVNELGNYTERCYNNTINKQYYCANGCYENVNENGDGCSPPDYFIIVLAFIILVIGIAFISWIYGRRG